VSLEYLESEASLTLRIYGPTTIEEIASLLVRPEIEMSIRETSRL
jgi:hypothetical protein